MDMNLLNLKGKVFRKYDGWNGSCSEIVIDSIKMDLEYVTISGFVPKWGTREPSDKASSYGMTISSFVKMLSYGSFRTFMEIDHCSFEMVFDIY